MNYTTEELKRNTEFQAWKKRLEEHATKETGEIVKCNDIGCYDYYLWGFTPEQTFRETWDVENDCEI